jgi:hypothetical protein
VIVNATTVVKDSRLLDARPGQLIRFPIEPTGRFQPVEINKWPGTRSINVPDMHEMDKVKAAGFSAIAGCTSADALGESFVETMKALELYLAKFHERPDKYQLVRTAADIDKAIAEDKLGIYFTHQGFGRPSRPDPRYATLKELNVDGRKPLTRVTAH